MKRFPRHLDLTSVIVLIAVGVLLPVLLSTAVGIVALVIARDAGGIVTGVLVICFAVATFGSALVTLVLTGRKARLARLQADFVANVSHELKTPLSAIRLYTQTLQSGKLDGDPEQVARCLATILRETAWLEAVIDQVLTWRSSSKDMLPLERERNSVAAALHDAVTRFKGMVDPDTMAFSADLHSELPVWYDPRALQAVLLNLLTNAYKYGGEEKRIELSARDETDRVVIEVRDHGAGLTPGEAKRVFQPFYRARRADGKNAAGTGLGLAIARYLVMRHDGTLSVHSETGHGSTFTISLPEAGDGP